MASETQPARVAPGPDSRTERRATAMLNIVVTVWMVIAVTITITVRFKRRR